MKDLKKYGAIGGAIVLVAIWPLAVGQIAQKVLHDGVAKIDDANLNATVVDYDRGYLSSVATSRYKLTDPVLIEQFQIDGIPTEITVKHEIKHGLLGIDAVSKPVSMPQLPLVLYSHSQLNGNTEFNLDIAHLNFQDPNTLGGSVSVARSQISGKASVLGELDYSFDFPSVQVKFDTGESLSFTEFTGSGKGKKLNGLWFGEHGANLKEISMENPAHVSLVYGSNLNYQFASSVTESESGSRVQTNHQIAAKAFKSGGDLIENLNIDFTLGDLDAEAFGSLATIFYSSGEMDNATINQSAQHIDTLFDKGFMLSMNQMKLNLGEGVFDSKWSLAVPQGTSNVTQNIMGVIPVLTGKMDTFISNELVDGYPAIQQGIDELVIMEMVKPVDKGYQMAAVVEDGNIVFESGQKVPLLQLLFSFFAM
ncbi:DUF945 family protein [Vibrio sp. JC009]|uniref:DUF945 family protein n=1 Tax=Vibrio sp. JC009 TaxID=2912314 RepID=UPI0023B0227A|nr:DUF945 family protein [Vibrio sp. JC009]WED23009.1 DUF945 family protein [Vibrio sp. JC009]